MCYWDDFTGQVPYGDPQGCIAQARADLAVLAPGRPLEYIPIFQGDSTPDRVRQAMDASVRAEATRVSLWRRGVVSMDVWSSILGYVAPSGPHCALNLFDGCVVTEAFQQSIYLVMGGAKLPINTADLPSIGLTERDIQTLPSGRLGQIPDAPADGTLLSVFGGSTYVIYGGAKFPVPDNEFAALGLNPAAAKAVPATALSGLRLAPFDYSLVQELGDATQYLVLRGARFPLDAEAISALELAGHGNAPRYLLPTGSLGQIAIAEVMRGDADCDGNIGVLDVVRVLQKAIGMPSAGICLHIAGDVTCDGLPFAPDALLILSYVAQVPPAPSGCPSVGVPELASLPVLSEPAVTPTPTAAPEEGATPLPREATASGTPTPDAATASPTVEPTQPGETPVPTPTPHGATATSTVSPTP
jgi:hypothetical protein